MCYGFRRNKDGIIEIVSDKWNEVTNAIGFTSKRGKNGGTMAHPFIACDFEMWNDMSFRHEVLNYFMSNKIDKDEDK